MTTKVNLNPYFRTGDVEIDIKRLRVILESRLDIEWVDYNPDVFLHVWRNWENESVGVSNRDDYQYERLDLSNLVAQCIRLLMRFGVSKKQSPVFELKCITAYDLESLIEQYISPPKGYWGNKHGVNWERFFDDCSGYQGISIKKYDSQEKAVLSFLDHWLAGIKDLDYRYSLSSLEYLLLDLGILEEGFYLVYFSD